MSTAIELLTPTDATPNNPAWHKLRAEGVSASEIAAVLGISPWDSPFSLYWQKINGWVTEDNEDMATGRRVEPVVADWWADTQDPHENLAVVRAGLYAHPDRPWQLATPDRLIYMGCPGCTAWEYERRPDTVCVDCQGAGHSGQLLAVLECKWTGSWDGWGEPGTDDIPVYYRAQVLQQCDVLGTDDWHLAVLGPGGFRAYQGRRDERDLEVMRHAGGRFVDRLAAGDAPDVDSHSATLATLKRLHPDVEDIDIEVPVEFAEGYRRARALRRRAEALVDRYEARARALLGSGRRLMCGGRLVVSRSVYDQSGDMSDLDSLDTDRPTVNRLNPDRSASYTDRSVK